MPLARLGPIRFLTIHCAATPEGRDNSAAEVNAWDIEMFGQISYHWIVELDGDAIRGLSDTFRGAHVGRANTGNIGICYVGGTTTRNLGAKPKDTRTKAQKIALRTLVRTYQARVPGIIVRGHNEWPGVAKACPSFSVAKWLAAGMPV
jgi:N-acetylmuramoyl-L-alanine amidase